MIDIEIVKKISDGYSLIYFRRIGPQIAVHVLLRSHHRIPELSLVVQRAILVLRQLQGLPEVLLPLLEVPLGRRYHRQLKRPLHLGTMVVGLCRQLKVLLHKQFHLILILRKISRAYLPDIPHGQGLPSQVGQLDGVLQGVLEVEHAVLVVSQPVVAQPQVNAGQELPIRISQVLMQLMILHRLGSHLIINIPQQLVVHSNTVISQGLSMTVIDALAHLQKFLIAVHCLTILLHVIIQHSH